MTEAIHFITCSPGPALWAITDHPNFIPWHKYKTPEFCLPGEHGRIGDVAVIVKQP